MSAAALVADIGGTNARFALIGPDGAPTGLRVFEARDFPTIEQAIETYLAEAGAEIRRAAIAVASPVTGDRITLTNSPWRFSTAALQARFQWERLAVLNDFGATALAVPHLGEADRFQHGPGAPDAAPPIAIVGPGSGLGVAGLLRGPAGWI